MWYIIGGILILLWLWGMGVFDSNTHTSYNYKPEKPTLPTEWNTLIQKESEFGVWSKEGKDIPNDKEIFIASPIKKVDENGNRIIINRWLNKEDAIKCINEAFKNL